MTSQTECRVPAIYRPTTLGCMIYILLDLGVVYANEQKKLMHYKLIKMSVEKFFVFVI